MNKNKKLGFTLAEVLIVIGIIGVVAALTLPNLNHATGDKETVTKVKKIYSTLSDAIDRAQVIYGDMDTWRSNTVAINALASKYPSASSSGSNTGGGKVGGKKGKDKKGDSNGRGISALFAERILESMKVSKKCAFDNGCFSSSPYIYMNGNQIAENFLSDLQSRDNYMAMLSDGISLSFETLISNYLKIKVDIDGPNKGKNQVGKDIFDFNVITEEPSENGPKNQLIPSVIPRGWTGYLNDCENEPGNYSTAWVIQNGNLDYLKCYDELNWETKTSCE